MSADNNARRAGLYVCYFLSYHVIGNRAQVVCVHLSLRCHPKAPQRAPGCLKLGPELAPQPSLSHASLPCALL